MTIQDSTPASSAAGSAVSTLPAILRIWLQERGFDVCPWYEAPNTTHKILGRDAWRFANVVLYRAPIGTDTLRYYVALCPKSDTRKVDGQEMIGYWLEVRKLPV